METKTHSLQDWETPQRQATAGLFILFIQTCWEIIQRLWFVLVVYLLRGRQEEESTIAQWLLLAFFVATIAITVLKFWFYKFYVKDDNLHIHSGWWNRKHTALPLQNIQAVHLEQGLWQQFFRIAKVSFDSTGSERIEAKINALSLKKAEAFKLFLLQETESDLPTDGQARTEQPKIYTLNDFDVLKLGLSANHFRAFVVLLVFSLKFFEDFERVLDADQREAMESYTEKAFSALSWVFFAIVFLLIAAVSVAVSSVRIFLEYYGFRMVETEKGWRVSHGLLTQKQKVITRSKIQLIEYRANALRSLMNFWFIDLGITGQNDLKQQAKINLPITSREDVRHLANQYLPEAPVREEGERISWAYWSRRVLLLALPACLLLCGILRLLSGEWFWASMATLVVLAYWIAHLAVWCYKFRWLAQEDGLTIFEGVWGQSYTLMQWQKVQDISLSQTIYQRQHNLATLHFSTAGGEVELPYLPLPTAQMLLNQTLYSIESRQASWL